MSDMEGLFWDGGDGRGMREGDVYIHTCVRTDGWFKGCVVACRIGMGRIGAAGGSAGHARGLGLVEGWWSDAGGSGR